MGLTIHYEILPRPGWTAEQVTEKLQAVRAFAESLHPAEVSPLLTEKDVDDQWFKPLSDAASRVVRSPHDPGALQFQKADRLTGFVVDLGGGDQKLLNIVPCLIR